MAKCRDRNITVNIATLYRATHHEMVPTPAVIGAITVDCQSATKIRRGKGGHIGLHPHFPGSRVESGDRVADIRLYAR